MSRTKAGFVLGFHGCDKAVADAVFSGTPMTPSAQSYDWLGSGIYFWEGDPVRAREWAEERKRLGKITEPAVIGAIIDLGHCLDLTNREDLATLLDAYQTMADAFAKVGRDLPINRDAKHLPAGNKMLRFLDNAVIEHLHRNIEDSAKETLIKGERPIFDPFDTVRGLFIEGDELYPGGGMFSHTHTQIAVRNQTMIKGYFHPLATES